MVQWVLYKNPNTCAHLIRYPILKLGQQYIYCHSRKPENVFKIGFYELRLRSKKYPYYETSTKLAINPKRTMTSYIKGNVMPCNPCTAAGFYCITNVVMKEVRSNYPLTIDTSLVLRKVQTTKPRIKISFTSSDAIFLDLDQPEQL